MYFLTWPALLDNSKPFLHLWGTRHLRRSILWASIHFCFGHCSLMWLTTRHGLSTLTLMMSRTYCPLAGMYTPTSAISTSDSMNFSFLRQPKPEGGGASTSSDIAVFVDGSCVNRGTCDARTGVGVYFGPNSQYNISQRLRGGTQTGQRAEVCAAALALERVDELVQNGLLQAKKVVLLSDSNHVIQGITSHMVKWKENEWKSNNGLAVEKDEFERLDERIEHLARSSGILVQFWHVSRHYNGAADRLAREAVTS